MDDTDIYSGDPSGATAAGVPAPIDQSQVLPGDVSDAQQMSAWNPPAAQAQGIPWWGGAAVYGITKAIDNQFPGSPTGIYGNVYPGSAGGYNGRTYTLRPIGAGGGATAAARVSMSGNPMLLILIAAGAFLLLK